MENKTQIGKIDDIFGPINERYFSVKLSEGIQGSSYESGTKFFGDPAKLLPLARFTQPGACALLHPKRVDKHTAATRRLLQLYVVRSVVGAPNPQVCACVRVVCAHVAN